jgi:enediyne biosynthesis protein E4
VMRSIACIVVACAFSIRAPAQTLNFDFDDVSSSTHPDYTGIFGNYNATFGVISEGGGIAIADYNKDGRLDVFFPSNRNAPNRLFRNNGNGTFNDVASLVGVTDSGFANAAALFIDYDNDGDRDLICFGHAGHGAISLAPNLIRVFRNRGIGSGYTFAHVTAQCGFALDATTSRPTTKGICGGATAGDFDRDGDLDLFVSYWQGTNNDDLWRLWRNEPNPNPGVATDPNYSPRIFVDATKAAGLDFDTSPSEPWQPSFVDLNRDNWLDLHVPGDFGLDFCFINNGDSTFTNVATAIGLNGNPPETRFEMGVAWGDVDFDGDLDIHKTNKDQTDRFYRNDSTPAGLAFVDVAPQTGLDDSNWGWGTMFFDVDNDGDLDHAACSGFKFPTATPWWNNFHLNLWPQKLPDNLTVSFQDVSSQLVEYSGNFHPEGFSSRAMTNLDLDGDGDLDIIQTRRESPNAVFLNTLGSGQQWIAIDLVGRGGSLHIEGSRIWLRQDGKTQLREIITGSSFLCHESPRQHFGLGSHGGTDLHWVVVRTFDGRYQIVNDLAVNAVNTIAYNMDRDDAGDMDGDRHLTALDLTLLEQAVFNWTQYDKFFGNLPGRVTGDIDGDGRLTRADLRLWKLLPPH